MPTLLARRAGQVTLGPGLGALEPRVPQSLPGQVVGFLAWNRHFPHSAEIHVMGILPGFHRKGIGRRLENRLEELLTAEGVRWLQVKTLSPSRESEGYRKTREFYSSLGFEPLEEFKTLWDEGNPCLQMIKSIAVPARVAMETPETAQDAQADPDRIRFLEPDREAVKCMNQWGTASRLEERTCRPVQDGKRVKTDDKGVLLACFLPGESSPFGRVSVFDFNPRNRSAEFGYLIDPARRSRGCGTRMIRAFLDYAFPRWNLNRLYCQTGAFNAASVRLLERIGFQKEGILRQHHELDGRLLDDLIFAILRSEWAALTKSPSFTSV